MGKKSKKNKKNKGSRPNSFAANANAFIAKENQRQINESVAKMREIDRLSLQGQKDTFREALIAFGTDCDANDRDPTGDGDQSMIQTEAKRDAAREMYSIGGDIHQHLVDNALSEFAFACAAGVVHSVQKILDKMEKKVTKPSCRSDEMKKLLESRETSLRLSPLLLITSAGKNCKMPGGNHEEVAKILLKYGASPTAKDVLGKTVAHYGAGAFATDMTLKVVDMCIRAAQTAHLYGKDVKLHGLNNIDMNGLQGVAGGFDPDSGRRLIFLAGLGKEVWVKPENVQLLESAQNGVITLTDIQDRLGSVSLHEVVMQNRKHTAEFLLIKHQTSIHTTDLDGVSPLSMSISGGVMMAGDVCKIINKVTRREGNAERKSKEECCGQCHKKIGEGADRCSRCKKVWYCNRDCQKLHWNNGHKQECTEAFDLAAGVKVGRPNSKMSYGSLSMRSGAKHTEGTYRKPDGIDTHERFVVKVQGGGVVMPILVYDESRTCEFNIDPETSGFSEIRNEMQKEMAWQGRKTFMKASFDETGACIIYPSTAGVKSKYSW